MIDSQKYVTSLLNLGVTFFSGVPDSLTSKVIREMEVAASKSPNVNLLPAANEGIAVSHCIGHFLATGRPGLVYMQNAGLGNAYNPFISLAHKDVYDAKMIFSIGWRGEPGLSDEPQHRPQGSETLKLLESMGIHTFVVRRDSDLMEGISLLESEIRDGLSSSIAFLFSRLAFQEE